MQRGIALQVYFAPLFPARHPLSVPPETFRFHLEQWRWRERALSQCDYVYSLLGSSGFYACTS